MRILSTFKTQGVGLLCEFCRDWPLLDYYGRVMNDRIQDSTEWDVWGCLPRGWTPTYTRVTRGLRRFPR